MLRSLALLFGTGVGLLPTVAFAVDWNFETGRLDGWTQSGGTAFANQPTQGNNIVARGRDARFAIQGNYFIGTFENHPNHRTAAGSVQGDAPTGMITSDIVTLTTNRFTCLLGGGQNFDQEYIAVLVKATPENRQRFEVDPRDPDSGRSIPFPRVRLSDGEYYEVLRETGRNEEAMRRVSMTMSYVRSGDQARVRIADLSSGAWGHINVDDIGLSASATSSLASRIHVTDETGANLPGAEVFVNGTLRGTSDATGMVSAGIVRAGDRIAARKRILEERTYRNGHGAGSTQNWKYRVYATSIPIGNDGSATQVSAHGDSARPEEVRVSRDNVLFGLNINVSVEWDATPAEVNQIRQDLNDTAAYFYNATDGQFTFEQIDLRTDARGWDNADFRVHADRDLRPHADIPFGWWDPHGAIPGLIHMTRTTMGWGGPPVYTHEFGHYGLGLFDEYLDMVPLLKCTGTGGPFAAGQPQASCMMWRQWEAGKICSNHASNPHIAATLQGLLRGTDCWTSIHHAYKAPPNSFTAAYNLKTPVSRGAIVGTLPPMPFGWRPRFIESTATHGEYLGAITLTVTEGTTPRQGVGVWLHTQEGRDLYQGATDAAGQMVILGCHNYDVVRFDGREQQVSPFAGGLFASIDGFGSLQQKNAINVKLPAKAPRLLIGTSLWSDGAAPTLTVRASSGKIDGVPSILVASDVTAKAQPVKAQYDERLDAYTAMLPSNTPTGAIVTVSGKIGGETLNVNSTVAFLVSEGEHLDLFTPDGGMVVRVPDGALTKGVKVAAGHSSEMVPESEGTVLAGPYSITASKPLTAQKVQAVLSFRLTPRQKASNAKGFRVLRYEGGKWIEVPGAVHGAAMGTVAVYVDRLGSYVLTMR
ncbi:hypothetical protein EON82_12765 [bacterium]|nr:MAG: hypothetical protein EON82_12765 [bacterium]